MRNLANVTGKLCVMTVKNDVKFEEELTCRFKIDMRNLTHFDPSTESLKNLHFNRLFLIKVYTVWAQKVQRSYLSWDCRVIEKSEGKITCGF